MNEPVQDAELVTPSNAVAIREPHAVAAVTLTERDINTLVAVGAIPKGTPPDVIVFFSKSCAETRLSPFKRQVHLIKRWSKDGDRYTVQTGIDGYRAIANRTGLYAGNDQYLFDEGINEYSMLTSNRKRPTTATATVYKAVGGVRCPFTASCHWDEYYPGEKQGFMWDKMPFLMLGKCAESLALRKAFPEELAGLYTDEEMAQADLRQAPPSQTALPLKASPEPSQSDRAPIRFDEAKFRKDAEKWLETEKANWVKANTNPQAWAFAVIDDMILMTEKLSAVTWSKLFTPLNERLNDVIGKLQAGKLSENAAKRELQLALIEAQNRIIKGIKETGVGAQEQQAFEAVYGPPGTSTEEPVSPTRAAAPAPARMDADGGSGEPFWDVICPIPNKGQKRADYEKTPDTIRSLYTAMKGGDDNAQKRLWGFAKHWDAAPREYNGKTYPPSAADIKFREALDQFCDWHELHEAPNEA